MRSFFNGKRFIEKSRVEKEIREGQSQKGKKEAQPILQERSAFGKLPGNKE
jgi:hypothetical protein